MARYDRGGHRRLLGNGHRAASVYNNLGELAAAEDDLERVRALFDHAARIFANGLGAEHPNVAYPLQGLGLALVDAGRAGEALPILERALAIRVKSKTAPMLVAETEVTRARAVSILAILGGARAATVAPWRVTQ